MLISEFATAAGLSVDTVRFYVRRRLLTPGVSSRGGSNPYQVFSADHVQAAKFIKKSQLLGFSLKEITVFTEEYRAGTITIPKSIDIMRQQLVRLEEKAAQLQGMTIYLQRRVAWMEAGCDGPEPVLTDLAATTKPSSPKGSRSRR